MGSNYGLIGIAWATTTNSLISFILIHIIIYYRHGQYQYFYFLINIIKMSLSSIFSAMLIKRTYNLIFITDLSWGNFYRLHGILIITAIFILYILIYLFTTILLKQKEAFNIVYYVRKLYR